MKWCQMHWNQLRDAVKIKGMEHLIYKDGATAVQEITKQIENSISGTSNIDETFDPLLSSYYAINARILQIRGFMYMLEGAPCPMCEPDDTNPTWADKWIDGSTEEAFEYAKMKGLIPLPV